MDIVGPADEFVVLLDKDLLEFVAVPVVDAVKVVKVLEGFVATPPVE
jgi:hypothetical protein